MKRSKWKGPYVDQNTFKILKINMKKTTSGSTIVSRNAEITPKFINQTVNIYNGKSYSEVNIFKDMLGHKFGEFSFTRVKFHFKKKKSKK